MTITPPLPDLSEDGAVTVQQARRYFHPMPCDQTIYRLIWSGELKVLDGPGITRIPLSEIRRFLNRAITYQRRNGKKATASDNILARRIHRKSKP